MSLRRPPTRIELKADDIEEFDKVRKEEAYTLFQVKNDHADARTPHMQAKKMAALSRIGVTGRLPEKR
ncbi:hypothetical protein FisN_1Hh656 [Fistulifera solaris]|uniref:Anaphase-promoting complex subunit CDC26 n=1 Tax=Fistulifera solaris TaxID=1519565 RepID=A0A1Z5KR19_FISSO|nr:hypothetical protein FisN_1Hh656 [Fistulifera solaris]|eukprot:GAX28555.1 hypothetical protein FisN_1Hh656 [Fistulifera solaris]